MTAMAEGPQLRIRMTPPSTARKPRGHGPRNSWRGAAGALASVCAILVATLTGGTALADNPTPSSPSAPKPSPVGTPKPPSVGTPKPSPVGTPTPSSVGTPKPSPVDTPKPSPDDTPKPSLVDTPKPSSVDHPPSSVGVTD